MNDRRARLALAATFLSPLRIRAAGPRRQRAAAPPTTSGATFSVDSALEPSLAWIDDSGSPLYFDFNIGAGFVGTLTIVDAVFGGDTFKVTNFGNLLGSTSSVPLADIGSAVDLGYDFDAALADSSFSSAVFTLGAGSYRIGGFLDQSLLIDGQRLDATLGAAAAERRADPRTLHLRDPAGRPRRRRPDRAPPSRLSTGDTHDDPLIRTSLRCSPPPLHRLGLAAGAVHAARRRSPSRSSASTTTTATCRRPAPSASTRSRRPRSARPSAAPSSSPPTSRA